MSDHKKRQRRIVREYGRIIISRTARPASSLQEACDNSLTVRRIAEYCEMLPASVLIMCKQGRITECDYSYSGYRVWAGHEDDYRFFDDSVSNRMFRGERNYHDTNNQIGDDCVAWLDNRLLLTFLEGSGLGVECRSGRHAWGVLGPKLEKERRERFTRENYPDL